MSVASLFAVIVHSPALTIVTVVPTTVQTLVVSEPNSIDASMSELVLVALTRN